MRSSVEQHVVAEQVGVYRAARQIQAAVPRLEFELGGEQRRGAASSRNGATSRAAARHHFGPARILELAGVALPGEVHVAEHGAHLLAVAGVAAR